MSVIEIVVYAKDRSFAATLVGQKAEEKTSNTAFGNSTEVVVGRLAFQRLLKTDDAKAMAILGRLILELQADFNVVVIELPSAQAAKGVKVE